MTEINPNQTTAWLAYYGDWSGLALFANEAMSRADLDRKLDQFIGAGRSVEETRFTEERPTRTVGIYAEDADWDDPDLEPSGYEEVPILVIRATRRFVPENV